MVWGHSWTGDGLVIKRSWVQLPVGQQLHD